MTERGERAHLVKEEKNQSRRLMMINKGKFLLHIVTTIFIKMVCSSTANTSKTSVTVEAMYVLGDSSVDCGENTLFFPFLFHNLSLHPCEGSPLSSLVPHLLAKRMGLPYSIPFYSQNGSMEVLLHGVNLGSTGATIMTNPTTPNLQSLNQQLRQAFEIFQLLQLQLGQETAEDFIRSSTLFYLSFGKDDYIEIFRNNSATVLRSNVEKLSRVLVNQMSNAIKYLYGSSVRKFVLAGILPLGCAPRFLKERKNSMVLGGSQKADCADEINNIVVQFNTLLEQRIVDLNTELADAQIIFCDVYWVMMEVINKPKAYGFDTVNSACCGVGTHGRMNGCMSMDMACLNASTYVWWDLFNPGHAVSSLIAESAWSGQPLHNICRPITVQKLVSSSSM